MPSNRRSLPLFLAAVAALGLVLFAGCSGDGEKKGSDSSGATVKLRRIEMKQASFDAMELNVIVIVRNTKEADLQLKGGELSVAIVGMAAADGDAVEDAEDVPEGVLDGSRHSGKAPTGTVPGFSETEVPYSVTLPLPTDPEALETVLGWRTLSVNVQGNIMLGGATETFEGEREVSAPELPEIELKEAQVASVDGGQAGHVFFVIGIHNPNTFEMKVDKFAWGMTVGGKELRKVGAPSTELVPPSAAAEFEDSSKLDDVTFGPEVKDLLKQPRVPYSIRGFWEVKGIRKEIAFDGEMEFPR